MPVIPTIGTKFRENIRYTVYDHYDKHDYTIKSVKTRCHTRYFWPIYTMQTTDDKHEKFIWAKNTFCLSQ